MMTLREVTALVLLYRSCPDEVLRRRILGMLPELRDLVDEPPARERLVVSGETHMGPQDSPHSYAMDGSEHVETQVRAHAAVR